MSAKDTYLSHYVAIAYLRDLDGTGSLHPASKGDPGAFPVYSQPAPSAQEAVAWTPQHCLDDIASGRSQMLPAYKSPGDADRTSWVPLFLSPPSPAHGALTALREGIERGVDEKKTRNSDYVTYGITIGDHENKIEVHGDPALRNLILDLLRPYAFPVR